MLVKDCKGNLKVGMRVRVEQCIEDDAYHNHREGEIVNLNENSQSFAHCVDIDLGTDVCTATEITILSKPMDITKAKYAIQYERDEDPVEYFKTAKDRDARIDELLEDGEVKKDRIYTFEPANLKKVERAVDYKLVSVK